MARTPIYKTICLRWTLRMWLFLEWAKTRSDLAIFGRRHHMYYWFVVVIDSPCLAILVWYRFQVILSQIWWIYKMPMFCFAALFIIQAILCFFLKEYRQNADSVDLLGCSNYFLSKYFVVFNHLKVKPVFYYMHISHSLMAHVNVTNNDSTKVISHFE